MSAAATAQWEIPAHQMELVERQASVFGCSNETLAIIMDCFNNVCMPYGISDGWLFHKASIFLYEYRKLA